MNRCLIRTTHLVLATMIATGATTAWAITVGQTDDFQDGTTKQWAWGRTGFGAPENVSGGQGGASDLYMQNESFGGDDAPGTRMTIFNRDQWIGDYLGQGISAINLDAINLGPNFAFKDMNLRLAFSSNTALVGGGRVVTSSSFLLERDAGWQSLTFDLSPSSLTPLAGSVVTEVMSSVSEVRIISAEQPSFIGDQFIARLGVDNISALPEPSSLALLAMCLSLGFSRLPIRRPS